jgi:uncharacterized protein (DUF924 family)
VNAGKKLQPIDFRLIISMIAPPLIAQSHGEDGSLRDYSMTEARTSDWAADVLRFWFEELQPTQWFTKDPRLDECIWTRFLGVHERVMAAPDSDLLIEPRTALAAVIALDQFPRNMFRGAARAFATDAKALALADEAVARDYDAGLSHNERLFLYLPFEHAEDPAMQARSVALFRALGNAEQTKYAEAHKAIIELFGRFPHRNAILGRCSTPAEEAFLKEPGSHF